jgi:hypothetical protein
MPIVSMASFKEAREKERKKREKNWKRQRKRYLGGQVHVAHWDYSCDNCIFIISAGEQYRRDKYVNAFGFRTIRTHWPQCYGPTEEEDREMRDQMEKEREAEQDEEKESERHAA